MSSFPSNADVDPSAAVYAEAALTVAAPVEVVWEVLTDVPSWPQWVPGVSAADLDGPVLVGAGFRWRSGLVSLRSVFLRLEKPNRLSWMGRTPGLTAVHAWELVAEGEASCLVRTQESMSGWLARLMSGTLRRKVQSSLEEWLEALELRVEGWTGPAGG